MVQWLRFHASTGGGLGLINLWSGEIPQGAECGQKKKKRRRNTKWPKVFNVYKMIGWKNGDIHKSLLFKVLLLFSHSVVSDSLWPMDCSTPDFPVLHHLPKLAQTHVHWVVMPFSHLILWHLLLLLPSIFPSIGVFSNESALCSKWPKC